MSDSLDIGTLSGRIELDDEFSPGLDAVANTLKGFGENVTEWIEHPVDAAKGALKDMLEDLGPVGVGVAAIGTIGIAAGTGLYEMTEKAAEAGEQVLAFARITGDAVSDVGALGAAAAIGGGSLDGLQGMLFQVQRRMDATGPGADKFNAALADLKVNADEFRSADPSDRVTILSDAMRNAAGSTNLMSDAVAIMGRGAAANMPLLLKNFDDLKEKGEEVAYQWSVEDTAAATGFNDAAGLFGQRIQGMATAVGVALMPAMTGLVDIADRTVVALTHVADLGGLVSGAWAMITGALGDTANADERNLAVQQSVNAMWAAAAKSGEDLSAATYDVAKQMLTMGYSAETTAEQTGLSVDAVKQLSSEMKAAQKAGEDYEAALDKANAAVGSGATDITQVDNSLRGWVKDMIDAKVSLTDIETVTGLSAGQIAALKKSFTDADSEQKKFTESMTALNSVGANYQATIAGIDSGTVDAIKYYLQAGVSQSVLATAYGLTAQQVAAVAKQRDIEVAGLKEEQQTAAALAQALDSLNKTRITDQITMLGIAEANDESYYKDLLNNGKITESQYSAFVLQDRTNMFKQQELLYQQEADAEKQALTDKETAEEAKLQDTYSQGKIDYDAYQASLTNIQKTYAAQRDQVDDQYTTASKQRQQQFQQTLQQTGNTGSNAIHLISEAEATFNTDVDNTNKKVLTLSGELMDAVKYKQLLDAGGQTDITSANFQQEAQSFGINVGNAMTLAKLGYSFQEILGYLSNQGSAVPSKLPPPAGPKIPGFRDGGIGDFGEGTLAVLHGKEAIVPLDSAPGLGGNTFIFQVNGTGDQVYTQFKSRMQTDLLMSKQFSAQ